jgi:hypothetical protein
MAAVPVTILNATITGQGGNITGATVTGELTITGLGVGGGPVFPPDVPGHPIVIPPTPGEPVHPAFPIVLPPDSEVPPGAPPGYPTHPIAGPPGAPAHPIAPPPGSPAHPIAPPGTPIPDTPPLWIPVWVPGYGWVAIAGFPHPTPSKATGRR